jgi:gliding motility-associated-like protein
MEASIKTRKYSFDRYGKATQTIKPLQVGWDGNYNGTHFPRMITGLPYNLDGRKAKAILV